MRRGAREPHLGPILTYVCLVSATVPVGAVLHVPVSPLFAHLWAESRWYLELDLTEVRRFVWPLAW